MLIDAHSHLDRYEVELEKALEEINAHQIQTISCSMDIPSYQRCLVIAKQCELITPIFGIHPWNAGQYPERLEELKPLIKESPMLGEIGLDFYFVKDRHEYQAQKVVFEFFLKAAREQDKVINVHTKGAEEEVLKLLRKHHIKKAIIHWYSGPLDIFREMVEEGYYFTVGVSMLQSGHVRKIGAEIPEHLLLTETDNPGAWKWLRGEPGMPTLIIKVVEKIAEVRKTSEDRIIEVVAENFGELMGE